MDYPGQEYYQADWAVLLNRQQNMPFHDGLEIESKLYIFNTIPVKL